MYTSNQFREDIRTAEVSLSKIRPSTQVQEILDLLQLLDRLSTGCQELGSTGIDLRAELTRVETVHNTLTDKDRVIVRALDRRGGLAKLRAAYEPPDDHWWWYLDQRVAERTARRTRRLIWGVVGGGALLAILVVLYVRFLRPDEATRLRYDFVFSGESQLQEGDYAAALESYLRAEELAPDDPEVVLMVGVMHEALERPEEAAAQYAKAEALYDTRALFLSMRSQKYGLLGWNDKSEADALAAIESDDQLPLAYCALGSAFESQGRIREAIEAMQACADLAREQGQDQLYVIAATRLATLLQMPSFDTPTPDSQQGSE